MLRQCVCTSLITPSSHARSCWFTCVWFLPDDKEPGGSRETVPFSPQHAAWHTAAAQLMNEHISVSKSLSTTVHKDPHEMNRDCACA